MRLLCRAETPGAASDRFTHTFDAYGKTVWQKWDKHLIESWQGELVCLVTECLPTHFPGNGDDDEKNSSDEDADKPKPRYDKSLPYELQKNDDGWPILPHTEDLRLSKLKDMIRSFITITYSKFDSITIFVTDTWSPRTCGSQFTHCCSMGRVSEES